MTGADTKGTPSQREKELADLAERLGQITKGETTAFETALLNTLRLMPLARDRPAVAFIHQDARKLTKENGEALARFFTEIADRNARAETALQLYNDMRGAIGVMLERLPPLPDPRYSAKEEDPLPADLSKLRR